MRTYSTVGIPVWLTIISMVTLTVLTLLPNLVAAAGQNGTIVIVVGVVVDDQGKPQRGITVRLVTPKGPRGQKIAAKHEVVNTNKMGIYMLMWKNITDTDGPFAVSCEPHDPCATLDNTPMPLIEPLVQEKFEVIRSEVLTRPLVLTRPISAKPNLKYLGLAERLPGGISTMIASDRPPDEQVKLMARFSKQMFDLRPEMTSEQRKRALDKALETVRRSRVFKEVLRRNDGTGGQLPASDDILREAYKPLLDTGGI